MTTKTMNIQSKAMRWAAAAVLACGLACGLAATAPGEAHAATKVGKTSITSVKAGKRTDGMYKYQCYIKITCAKAKNAKSYQFKVYEGSSTKGKLYCSTEQTSPTLKLYAPEGQTFCVKSRGISGKWYLKGKKSYGAWSKAKVVSSPALRHTITYNLDADDATMPADARTSFTCKDGTFDLPVPTRPGYVFSGWKTFDYITWYRPIKGMDDYWDYNREYRKLMEVASGTTQDLNLTATWAKQETCYDHLGNRFDAQFQMLDYWGVDSLDYSLRYSQYCLDHPRQTPPVEYLLTSPFYDHLGNAFLTKEEMFSYWGVTEEEFCDRWGNWSYSTADLERGLTGKAS